MTAGSRAKNWAFGKAVMSAVEWVVDSVDLLEDEMTVEVTVLWKVCYWVDSKVVKSAESTAGCLAAHSVVCWVESMAETKVDEMGELMVDSTGVSSADSTVFSTASMLVAWREPLKVDSWVVDLVWTSVESKAASLVDSMVGELVSKLVAV